MSILQFSILSGTAFSIITILIMLPMEWKSNREKTEAIVAATIERFAIGFVVANFHLLAILPLNGLVLGILMSLPSAIITRAYVPVLLGGGLGATLIGLVQSMVGL